MSLAITGINSSSAHYPLNLTKTAAGEVVVTEFKPGTMTIWSSVTGELTSTISSATYTKRLSCQLNTYKWGGPFKYSVLTLDWLYHTILEQQQNLIEVQHSCRSSHRIVSFIFRQTFTLLSSDLLLIFYHITNFKFLHYDSVTIQIH